MQSRALILPNQHISHKKQVKADLPSNYYLIIIDYITIIIITTTIIGLSCLVYLFLLYF